MSAHLQGGRVDISLVQTAAWGNLAKLLEKCPGTKAIVWDNTLAGPVGLIAEYIRLSERSVRKMYPLRPIPLPETNVDHIIFIARPKLHLMDYIAKNVKDDAKGRHNSKKQYHLFFVPKKSLLCEEALKHQGVFGNMIFIEEFNCQLFPFDSDVVSMEIPEVFREFNIENDPTYIYQTAQAIIFLQKLYGQIPRVWGKGVAAKQVWDLVTRLQREKNSSNDEPARNEVSCIDQIILIDRSIDLITPLATQLTYEGLIDEIFGINNTTVNFPIDNFLSSEERSTESLSEDKKQVILNSSDKIFADIRDKSFKGASMYLAKQAKNIASQIESTQEKTSVQEMKLYVQRLPQILAKKKQIALHTSIAECIKEHTDEHDFVDILKAEQEFLFCFEVDKPSNYIEELIALGKPFIKVLRLICLQCLCSSGLKPKVLEGYKKELVQVYGLKALLAITKLEKVGLFKVQSSTRQYTVLRKMQRLVMEDVSEINPTDICYVHTIYAPLSVRLVEQVTKIGGWKHLHDVLGLLPGPTLDESPSMSSNTVQNFDSPKVVLVFFIGGCTFAEISALRFLSQQEDSNVEFVIATTKLINGDSFLKSIIEG
ncbi:vacuolar protein sorting-associated protein 33A [Euwallacea fornicatus]|uniref:vacuolar protein sorting-associated protein 33A n=1 Tax=Euwallacea fornicatus TaxID=995702 RepID=UPI00339005EC